MSSDRKHPSGTKMQKLKQEVLNKVSKMPKLTAYFGPLRSISFLKEKSISLFIVVCTVIIG
jgi:hypothetical protein